MKKPILGVGIVGCGLIGRKRALSLGEDALLLACADIDLTRASSMPNAGKSRFFSNWQDLIRIPEIDIVVVATLHDSLAEITKKAVEAGKYVLVEKPAARHFTEIDEILETVPECRDKVRVGFNHRYHRSIQKAKEIIDRGELGDLMFIRARYGHGGRVGYDKEWRADPKKSGGGELIDQGPHIVDLARWFLGDLSVLAGRAYNYFWEMAVEDNAFVLLENLKKQAAFIHVSCTEWKNTFSFEIYGKFGKIDLFGLGGSYGTEKITLYKMSTEMGPPDTFSWEYPSADTSWNLEIKEFMEDIAIGRVPSASLDDARATLHIIDSVYRMSGYDYRS